MKMLDYPKVSNAYKVGFMMRTGVAWGKSHGAPVTRKWRNGRNWWKPEKKVRRGA